MQPTATKWCSVGCLSVFGAVLMLHALCMSVSLVVNREPCKTAEPIEVLFVFWNGGLLNHVLDGAHVRYTFWRQWAILRHAQTCPQVDVLKMIRQGAAGGDAALLQHLQQLIIISPHHSNIRISARCRLLVHM